MRYFSMFSGIGGFELGIRRATKGEWGCVGYSEIDKHAIKTYEKHFGGHKNYGDATKINADELPKFDFLVGGFPCQAFSIAGKRGGFEDTRGTLFFEIARILKAKQPRMFLLENVKGLLNHDKGETFTKILQTIDELGYNAEWQVLNSKHFGVPQNRERVFIIGHLRETSSRQVFPISGTSQEPNKWASSLQHPGHSGGNYKGMNMIREITGNRQGYRVYNPKGIMSCSNAQTGGITKDNCIAVLTPDRSEKRQNGRRFMIVEKIKRKVRIRKYIVNVERLKEVLIQHKLPYTIKEIAEELKISKTKVEHWFRSDNSFAIPEDTIWFKLKELLRIKTNEFDKPITEFEIKVNKYDQSNRVYHKDGISPTLTALTSGYQQVSINNGYSIRRLTPIECERLQGFPDNWTIGSDSQRYKQIGNAVTVNVVEAIIRKIYEIKTREMIKNV